MTRDEIIRMASECGFEVHERKQQVRVGMDTLFGCDSTAKLERFAALVAAAEREACAKLCEEIQEKMLLAAAKRIRDRDEKGQQA